MKRRELRCAHHSVSGRNATAKRSPALCSRETTPPRLQRWSELGKELGLLGRGKGGEGNHLDQRNLAGKKESRGTWTQDAPGVTRDAAAVQRACSTQIQQMTKLSCIAATHPLQSKRTPFGSHTRPPADSCAGTTDSP
jgi:hypothetical protein